MPGCIWWRLEFELLRGCLQFSNTLWFHRLSFFYRLSNSPHQQVRKAWLQDQEVVGWRHLCHLSLLTRGELVSLLASISCTKNIDKVEKEDSLLVLCGFRGSRSCTDMIFTVRQLLEKSRGNIKFVLQFCRSKKRRMTLFHAQPCG